VFIRAPHILEACENVEVLSEHNGRIVAAKQDQFLGCSFHPELTEDHRVTQLFVQMVEEYKQKALV
ncbi:pyridoxal 5'-phosphate synthase subunit PdxT, partial [Bacillus spizizenii]|nr:pyridoxal 5'-phosphate synthase subunit PdxT [Bacillus spizizenii]